MPVISRASVWACIALVLLVAVGVLGWRAVADRTLDEVTVEISDHDCRGKGTKVSIRPAVLRVETSRDMRCTFTVDVVNGGTREVRLGEVRAAIMGPETGSVLLAAAIDGVAPHGEQESVDALHTLDLELPSEGQVSFDIEVVFHPEGCNDAGTLTLEGFPKIEVSTLRTGRSVDGASDLAFHNDIRTPGCGRLDGA
jgi:hypothetical protein